MKKILTSAAFAMALVAMPLAMGVRADAGGFAPLQANAAWNYGAYRVEKLAFSENAVGPFTLGESVFVAEPETGGLYTLILVKNGAGKAFPHVPKEAFSADRFFKNGNRLMYAVPIDDEADRYAVVEIDVKSGQKKTVIDSVFVKNARSVDVMTSPLVSLAENPDVAADAFDFDFSIEDQYFFEFEYDNPNPNKAYRQQAVFVYDAQEGVAYPITQHYDLRREEIQDVYDGRALVKLTFEAGNEELWIMDSRVIDGRKGSMKAIKGTWTDPDADIVGAHFRYDGSAEFFKNFTRHTYRPGIDDAAVVRTGETITWFRDVNASYVSDGWRMAWIDADDRVHMSTLYGATKDLGVAAYGRFHLEGSKLYFASEHSGKVIESLYGATAPKDLSVAVLDVNGRKAVGINGLEQIAYLDQATGVTFDIGFGSSPVVDQDGRAYWRGKKSGIYSAAFVPGAGVKPAALKDASGHFVKGTRVKFEGKPKVFVVGSDLRLNSIPDEATAQSLFGRDWNKGIVTVKESQMIDYPLGGVVYTSQDLSNL
ncbi:hypothetical protein EPO34_02900 [Patescibacteria group bacterium]|nr:MAG: hypothetical protein EPO34_02900 [Patescibacteria group bacterium]